MDKTGSAKRIHNLHGTPGCPATSSGDSPAYEVICKPIAVLDPAKRRIYARGNDFRAICTHHSGRDCIVGTTLDTLVNDMQRKLLCELAHAPTEGIDATWIKSYYDGHWMTSVQSDV